MEYSVPAGKTPVKYLARAMRESILTRHPTGWLTPYALSVSKWIAAAQDRPSGFQNYMIAPDLHIRVRAAKLNNEFGLASLMALRSPPGTLLMRRASDTDMISQLTPRNARF